MGDGAEHRACEAFGGGFGPSRRLKEREIKVAVAGLDVVRERLRAAGARLERPACLESNQVFDRLDAPVDERLRSRRELLRLRSDDGGSRLTYKSAPRFVGMVKERVEHEFSVDDPVSARLLLESLGFEVTVRYEKVRERWQLDGCEVSLDRTPMGDFVEVEQQTADLPPDRIEEVCRRCGLDPGQAAKGSYLALYREYRGDRQDLPEDMLFHPSAR